MRIHTNATTNAHIRTLIQNTTEPKQLFCKQYGISRRTFQRWRNRETTQDNTSRPRSAKRKLSSDEDNLICAVRTKTNVSAKYIQQVLKAINVNCSISTIYRCFHLYRLMDKKREEPKKFDNHGPGFIHVDVTYLPKFCNQKYYLYVAIDRCTRLVFAKIYKTKEAENTINFMDEAEKFYPFKIEKILTDNGKEF